MKEYYKELNIQKKCIPVIRISDQGRDYNRYFDIICEMITNVQKKISELLKTDSKVLLCPLECITLHYIMEIIEMKSRSSINIIDIYDIIDSYSNSFTIDCKGHDLCLCKKHFCKTYQTKTNKTDKLKLYLKNHFDKINDIKTTMDAFHSKHPNINWLVNQSVKYNGNSSFGINNRFTFIGYDDECAVICYVKPQFNSLNYNEILINSIFDTHFMHNISPDTDNYIRFNGKKIITCVFTLDQTEPYYIEWQDSELNNIIANKNDIIVQQIKDTIIKKYKQETNTIHYFYTYWRTHCPEKDKTPLNFIAFLKDKLQEQDKLQKLQRPVYINDFFNRIEFEINNCKGNKKKELLLQEYEDATYFSEKLNDMLEVSVKRYFGMNIDEDDDEDDDELV